MPLYEYECAACGRRFELIRKFSDPPVEVCTACGQGPVQRLLSTPAIQFKGTGWYVTDYARKGHTESSKPAGDKAEAKGDGGKAAGASTSDGTAKTDASPAADGGSKPSSAPGSRD